MSTFDPHRYTITIKLVTLEEGDYFQAVVAELPDLVEYGESYEQAYSLAVESIADLNAAATEQGRPFPSPMALRETAEFSGRVTLRMARSLHGCASKLADRDGVSLNSWIVEAIAARVGGGMVASAAPRVFVVGSTRSVNAPTAVSASTVSARLAAGAAPIVRFSGAPNELLPSVAGVH
jgi:predicted RNase H-like HicB family nuclease